MIEQVPHDAATEEAGSAEDRDQLSASARSRGLIHCHLNVLLRIGPAIRFVGYSWIKRGLSR